MRPIELIKLAALRAAPKFVEEPNTIYNGMRPEGLRQAAENQLNGLIDRLIRDPAAHPTRKDVLREVSKTLAAFPAHDSEDRDRMCGYAEQIMDIFGIESSSGLLARWRYGWLLGTLLVLMPRK